jgi:hypothetical protein
MLVGERHELLLVDETALRGLLDEALGRREIVQVNRSGQLNPFLGRMRGRWERPSVMAPARGWFPRRPDQPSELYNGIARLLIPKHRKFAISLQPEHRLTVSPRPGGPRRPRQYGAFAAV